MISAAEMSLIQSHDARSFTSTAMVKRQTSVRDTSGGARDTYPTVATYPCSFSAYPVRPREVESANRIQLVEHWAFLFPAYAVILPTDRIAVGTRTFEIVSSGIGGEDIVLKVICTEII